TLLHLYSCSIPTLRSSDLGALEIIVYAGAIMVLFVFVVMMLNLGGSEIEQERQWLKPQVWIGPAILSAIMLVVIVYAILGVNDRSEEHTSELQSRENLVCR